MNKRPENHRYEALVREDWMQPGAPVVFKASKLSENYTYSASSLGYAWMLQMFEGLVEKGSGFKVENSDVIVEFGAGTGLFPKLLRNNLGYVKDYVTCDLDVFSNVQAFHLRSAGYDVVRDGAEWGLASGDRPYILPTLCTTKAEDVLKVASAASGGGSKKIFIATWSLSEAPHDARMMAEKTIIEGSSFTLVFIAYQKKFGNNFGSGVFVDNSSFFDDFSARLETALGMNFHQVELEGGVNVLLVGERRVQINKKRAHLAQNRFYFHLPNFRFHRISSSSLSPGNFDLLPPPRLLYHQRPS